MFEHSNPGGEGRKTTAMILAGGRGQRMQVLCHNRSKPVLPFAGRLRVIDFTLSNCLHSEINDIAVLADYQRDSLRQYLNEWARSNAGGARLEVLEPRDGSYKGTADAVLQNLDFIRNSDADRIVILAGDHVYRMDYRKMLAFHEQTGADATVGVVTVPLSEAHRFGVLTADSDGRITEFAEKPATPASNLASMGIYIFDRRVLEERLREDGLMAESAHDFGYSLLPRMVAGNKLFAYSYDGYWQDIGNMEAYFRANMELLRESPLLGLNGQWPVYTQQNNFIVPKPFTEWKIKHSIVSPGCVVRGEVENSVLSAGVVIEEGAVVRNSILLENVIVGKRSIIDRCILDEKVKVGDFCFVGFRPGISPNAEITVLGKGVAIPPGTAIGHNCKVLPEVKPTEFVVKPITHGCMISVA